MKVLHRYIPQLTHKILSLNSVAQAVDGCVLACECYAMSDCSAAVRVRPPYSRPSRGLLCHSECPAHRKPSALCSNGCGRGQPNIIISLIPIDDLTSLHSRWAGKRNMGFHLLHLQEGKPFFFLSPPQPGDFRIRSSTYRDHHKNQKRRGNGSRLRGIAIRTHMHTIFFPGERERDG